MLVTPGSERVNIECQPKHCPASTRIWPYDNKLRDYFVNVMYCLPVKIGAKSICKKDK